MYSHCIFCHASLGANRSIEGFPVGSRLAFDEHMGRLWVVCDRCRRWNLSPLEERWEAIEQCERSFRTAVRRVSTDHIGLAVLQEGLELVRIGQPLRPELAAWRYGRHLLKRRRDHFIQSLPRMAFMGGSLAALPLIGLLTGPFMFYEALRTHRIVLRVEDEDGLPFHVRARDANSLRLVAGERGDWSIDVSRGGRRISRRGDEAVRIAGRLLPHINAGGAGKTQVEHAVREIERHGTGEDFFRQAARRLAERAVLLRPNSRVNFAPDTLRIALEMAAHEDVEHRAMQGELASLEAAWREADEIAAIADGLFLPRAITDKLRLLRGDA